jgi:hypothetical protein
MSINRLNQIARTLAALPVQSGWAKTDPRIQKSRPFYIVDSELGLKKKES